MPLTVEPKFHGYACATKDDDSLPRLHESANGLAMVKVAVAIALMNTVHCEMMWRVGKCEKKGGVRMCGAAFLLWSLGGPSSEQFAWNRAAIVMMDFPGEHLVCLIRSKCAPSPARPPKNHFPVPASSVCAFDDKLEICPSFVATLRNLDASIRTCSTASNRDHN